MKIIINRAIFRFRSTDQAVIPALPEIKFRGNMIQGPIRCEFRDNALTIKGTFPRGGGKEFYVVVPLNLGVKSFARAIQFAMDRSCDGNRSPRLPHHDRIAVQDSLLEMLLPREERLLNNEVEFALSPATSKPSEWTVVNLSPDGLEDARKHVRVQASTFAKLAL